MANNLFNQINQPSNNILGMINNLKNCQNPQDMLNVMAKSNPQLSSVMNMLNSSGMSAKDLFYQQAQAKGIDPQTIINQLK